jgi:elongation factor Ts
MSTTITAKEVNNLRNLTGAGMMDCKKALTEASGDTQKAIEILRKKGQKIAIARSQKETTEGCCIAATTDDMRFGAIVALSCETDFVAKNEAFQQLLKAIITIALKERPAHMEALQQIVIDGLTIQEKIAALVGKMGENITLSTYETLSGQVIVPYIHTGSRLSVLVNLSGVTNTPTVLEAGKNVAMQIAALAPIALDKAHISDSLIEHLKQEHKEKLDDFVKENTLLSQPFLKDNDLTIEQYLQQVSPVLRIVDFKRVVVGMGNAEGKSSCCYC